MKYYVISEEELKSKGIIPDENKRVLQFETLGDVLNYINDWRETDGKPTFPFEKVDALVEELTASDSLYIGEDFCNWVDFALQQVGEE